MSRYEELRRTGGLRGLKGNRPDRAGANRVQPADYLRVTRKYLEKRGPDASVEQIWTTMRAENTPVGHWLNPCLIYLDPKRFSHLNVSDKVPQGFPIKIVERNGVRKVVGKDGRVIG